MKKIPHRFGPFAIKTADGQADLAYRLNDLIDQLAQDQAGQMEHRGRAHTGADIRRAGGQITNALIVCELELVLQRGVDLIQKFEGLL